MKKHSREDEEDRDQIADRGARGRSEEEKYSGNYDERGDTDQQHYDKYSQDSEKYGPPGDKYQNRSKPGGRRDDDR